MERCYLLEEIKCTVSHFRVREVGDLGTSGPGDDADEENADNDCTLDAEHHQEDGEKAAAKDADPHSRIAHLIVTRAKAGIRILVVIVASCQLHGSGCSSGDGADTSRVGKSNQCQVKTDTDTSSKLDRRRDSPSKPLAESENGKSHKDEAFYKHGSESDLVRDQAGTVKSNDSVCKIGVETHARRTSNRHVGEEAHGEGGQSGDGGSGSDEIAADLLNALQVFSVVGAEIAHALGRTNTGTASFRDNSAVDRDNVGHGEEGGKAGADFREEVGTLAFLGLRGYQPHDCDANLLLDASTHVSGALKSKVSAHGAAGNSRVGLRYPCCCTHDVNSRCDGPSRKIKRDEREVAVFETTGLQIFPVASSRDYK